MPSKNRGRHCKTWYSFLYLLWSVSKAPISCLLCKFSFNLTYARLRVQVALYFHFQAEIPNPSHPIHPQGPSACLLNAAFFHNNANFGKYDSQIPIFHHNTKEIRSRCHLYLTNWPPLLLPRPPIYSNWLPLEDPGVRPATPRLVRNFFPSPCFHSGLPMFFLTHCDWQHIHISHISYIVWRRYQVVRNFFPSHDFTKACFKTTCKFCPCFFFLTPIGSTSTYSHIVGFSPRQCKVITSWL